jgi:hypothetical protein
MRVNAERWIVMKGRALRGLLQLMVCLLAGSFGVAYAQTTAPVSSTAAPAAIPRLVQFSGTLKGVNGRPLTGVVGVTFSIYADQEGGAALWMETQNVTADAEGKYTVFLGAASNGIPDFVFVSGQGRWLGVQAGLEPEMPRVLLVSVPYALKAGDANTLGGLPPSAFLLAGPVAPLTASGAGGSKRGSPLSSATSSDVTTTGGTVDYLPLWTGASTVLNSALFQSGTKIGIGTTAPGSTLDVRGNIATNSVFGFSNVQETSSPYGVYISAPASETLGFFTRGQQQMTIDNAGNASQRLTAGGLVKAMVYVNGTTAPYKIVRCYNSTLTGAAATTPPCGFTLMENGAPGNWLVDFGFEVENRIWSATLAGWNGILPAQPSIVADVGNSSTQLLVFIWTGSGSGAPTHNWNFTLVVY